MSGQQIPLMANLLNNRLHDPWILIFDKSVVQELMSHFSSVCVSLKFPVALLLLSGEQLMCFVSHEIPQSVCIVNHFRSDLNSEQDKDSFNVQVTAALIDLYSYHFRSSQFLNIASVCSNMLQPIPACVHTLSQTQTARSNN